MMETTNTTVDWLKELKSRNAYAYIKPNRYVHDSGFRCFEVGYCITEKARVKDKLVLGRGSDHIWLHNYLVKQMGKSEIQDLNMDLTLDGYIRLFSHLDVLWWGSLDWVVSSAELEVLCKIKSDQIK